MSARKAARRGRAARSGWRPGAAPHHRADGWIVFGWEGPDAAGFLTLTINDLKVAGQGRGGAVDWLISRRQLEELGRVPGIIDALRLLNTPMTKAEFEAWAGVELPTLQ